MRVNNIHILSRGIIVDQGHILLCKTLGLSTNFYLLPSTHAFYQKLGYKNNIEEDITYFSKKIRSEK